jgi:hypothetical protein
VRAVVTRGGREGEGRVEGERAEEREELGQLGATARRLSATAEFARRRLAALLILLDADAELQQFERNGCTSERLNGCTSERLHAGVRCCCCTPAQAATRLLLDADAERRPLERNGCCPYAPKAAHARMSYGWGEATPSGMLTYARICSHMLTYAHVCSRMLTYADVMSYG